MFCDKPKPTWRCRLLGDDWREFRGEIWRIPYGVLRYYRCERCKRVRVKLERFR